MTSAFCRTLVLIAAGAALLAAGTLQADPVPASPELPSGRTSRVAPPRLAPDRFTAEGPLEAVAVPLDGWTVVWPGQTPEDEAGSASGIAIARTNVVIGGQPSPALQFTFTRGTYTTHPLIELPFPFNANIRNVLAFKAKVETSAGLQPLGFGMDMPRYGYDAGCFNKYYDNFGVSVYDGKFDGTAVAVPTTHFLYHVDRHDPGVDGFKDFQWDMRYDDHSCNTDIIWAMLDKSGTVYTRRPNLDAIWGDALDKPAFVLRGWGGSMGILGSRNRCNYIGNEDVAMFHIPGGHILSPSVLRFLRGRATLQSGSQRQSRQTVERVPHAGVPDGPRFCRLHPGMVLGCQVPRQ